ncbi:phosphotransferase [Rhizobium sp. BK602]|uniref:phosphotransferase n=1 Tax=Rhizobium sp. BK602 TaxID=2586986 RepID=UPI00161C6A66|nr:phosphotransferase [Rhizobium sp. BK602]MBB3609740.1 Ser/Thr protein kinase RdoA (MazF antagonist) [Rhizobium sp. BK602]
MLSSSARDAGIGAELKTGAAAVPADQAEAVAREKYGLDGRMQWLWGEKDSNYRLTLADGRDYLFKVLNPAEDPGMTSMHSQALLHVEAADPGIPVQRIIRTLDGEADFRMTAEDGGTRGVRMVTFLPGIAQKAAPHSKRQRRNVGALLARMQMALSSFTHPAAGHRITWDMQHAIGMRDLLPVFSDVAQRRRLEAAMDDFETRIVPVMASLPAQVVHNDFNMENILVDPETPETVSGIIDFGDMVHAPRVFDVAVAAAYQMGDATDPIGAICDFLEEYSTLVSLTAQEIAVLYPAILTRMVMRLAIPQWRAGLFPENRDFYVRNSPTVWAQFTRLDAIPAETIVARLATACQQGKRKQ